uniref:hypothetical protein Ycf21 n=1 Tax=Hypnea cervicornis TaxID=387623 RepID=UPI0021B64270|nr:hypothetical protein Ycf21 [Hypnea cervicornis]UVW80783.1 hypothetical protein Ycf21 [Hypnea cervicornis]
MHTYTDKFHKCVILDSYKINNNSYINKLIPKVWQLILINDGSFTKHLTSLTGQEINIDVLSKYKNRIINSKKKEPYG